MGSDGPSVVLATSTEEELAQWMAALCQAAVEEVRCRLGKVEGGITPVYTTRFNFSHHSIPWWSIPIPFHGGQLPFHSTVVNLHLCRLPPPQHS